MQWRQFEKAFLVAAAPATAWAAIRSVGAIHAELATGFVTATELEGNVRTVTFVNGFTVKERIVTIDDEERRLVYAAFGGRTTHHNASFEVLEADSGRARVVWTTDMLPDDATPAVESMMAQRVDAIQRTLGRPSCDGLTAVEPSAVVVD